MGEIFLFIQNKGSDCSQTRGKHDYKKGQKDLVKTDEKKDRGINICPRPMTPTHVARPNKCRGQLSTSHPTAKIETSSLTAIWRSRAIIIMAPILRSWNNCPWDADLSNRSDGCMRNRKSYLRYMCGLMTEALETQTISIALLMPHGQEIRIVQNLQGTVMTSF